MSRVTERCRSALRRDDVDTKAEWWAMLFDACSVCQAWHVGHKPPARSAAMGLVS